MLIRRTELHGRIVDVRIANGTVVEIGALTARGEETLDAEHGALLPGLCDHHLHLLAMAAAERSVLCGPPAVRTAQELATALSRAESDEHGWVRGVGYTEEVAGPLDSAVLDRLHAGRPVRIQHRSGALWVVNTAGARALGVHEPGQPHVSSNTEALRPENARPPAATPYSTEPDTGQPRSADAAQPPASTPHGADHPGIEAGTGRLWRADGWLRDRLPASGPPDLRPVGERLARLGITHVTDATPDLDAVAIRAMTALPQRVHLLGVPLGEPSAAPYKIIVSDEALPALTDLVDRIRAVHVAGRPVAVHCVTREALILLLAALETAGARAGDRIEHGALIPRELIPQLRELGLTVVTQPGFVAHRGDGYLREVPAADRPDLYRARSLVDAGVPCALSSDAPYGPLDPWQVVAAAVSRRTESGKVLGAAERLTPEQALHGLLGRPDDPGGKRRRVAPGVPADLVLLRVPLAAALARPSADLVAATLVGGAVVFHRR